jgi:GTP pyrophosphokinase
MQGKGLPFAEVFDVRAVRVIVANVADCYAALARVQERFPTLPGEFDDYIARPKANGYQSLHTVVREAQGRTVEIQIRTRDMHERAEHGVAAHWAYKESGVKGYAGASADAELSAKVEQARKAVLRQLLAWERDFVGQEAVGDGAVEDRIYVFTPAANVVELPAGATPIDFAYAVHTDLGHRCRGARVDGAMVPLNTALLNGQTVEVIAAKDGGPSLDWLNGELGYLKSARSKTKARAWFNALAQRHTVARGREQVEKLLQREGKTSTKLDDLASRLGFRNADALFEVIGKDEFSIRNIETLLRPATQTSAVDEEALALKRPHADTRGSKGGVLVVGVESLLTSLARC